MLIGTPRTARSLRGRTAVAGVILAGLPIPILLLLRPGGLAVPGPFYLPVHSALEMLAVAAYVATFAVQWFAAGAGAFREARARFIGPMFLGAAILETAHLLTFRGMPGFLGPASAERAIHYWLAARAMTVGALLLALRIERKSENPLLRRGRVLAASIGIVAAFVVLEVAFFRNASYLFVEGRGLTSLKVALEAAIVLAAVVGAILHARTALVARDPTPPKLAVALAMLAYAETCFTLYADPFDWFNVVGHLYLTISVWFVFDALFVSALVRPYHELDALKVHVEDELVVSIRRLRETTEQREDLLRAVSHDLRNPLQIVLLQAQRLHRVAEDPLRRSAAAILGAAKRMERMLRDLADSARSDGGQLEIAAGPLSLGAFVREVIDSTAGVLDGSRVANAIADETPLVLADPDRLDRIFVNLVGNALKYSQGQVVVRAQPDGDAVRISVTDHGPGIAGDDLPRVFDRYYRGQRHEGEGLGLGLYIVRKLVEAHGGRIWAESNPGEGSTFTFTLPLAPTADPRVTSDPSALPGP